MVARLSTAIPDLAGVLAYPQSPRPCPNSRPNHSRQW
jgi:hypothetical protein